MTRTSHYQKLAVAYCLLLGVAHILNLQPAGDGLWFWYAHLTRSGSLLYTDLHFSLQPLFVLLTGWFQAMFGTSWLGGKILAAVRLVVYVWLLRQIARCAPIGDLARGLLIAGVFSLTIAAAYYRFDDYHITSDILGATAIYLLLRMRDMQKSRAVLGAAVAVGACCGLCIANRVNDGGTLLAGCALGIAFLAPRVRVAAVLACVAAAPACMLAVVLATHDTLHQWVLESIVRAAAIKGGTGNVLLYPVTLPWHLILECSGWRPPVILAYLAALAVCVRALIVRRKRILPKPYWDKSTAAAAAVGLVCLGALQRQSRHGTPVLFFTIAATFVMYFADLTVTWRACHRLLGRPAPGWTPREILLLIPFGQLIAGAMTSAHTLPDLYPPLAFTLLLLPIVFTGERMRRLMPWLLGVCGGLVFSVSVAKITHPYFWHFFNAGPMFQNRTWYSHPLYGPMYIENDQLAMMRTMCASVNATTQSHTLLAMPYPYPNYFCGIAPWHGYVQTWYDTSSRQTIETLTSQLAANPPEWIAYERDLGTLRVHEKTFNQGRPLPHRQVDRLINDKLMSHAWTLTQRSCLHDSHWMLIHTVPQTAPSAIQQSYIDNPRSYCRKDFDDVAGQ